MYTLITAIMLNKDKPSGLVEIDISLFTLNQVFSQFRTGYLVLTNSFIAGEHFLTLEAMRSNYIHNDNEAMVIKDWLLAVNNKTLPTTKVEPEYEFSKVNYTDGPQGGFDALGVHPTSTIGDYPPSSLTDLYLKKDSVDPIHLTNNVIAVINGYLHRHDPYCRGIKVTDGARSMHKAKDGQYGLLSFANVGGVQTRIFAQGKVTRHNPALTMLQECVVDLGIPLTGKNMMLSIAGQLIYADDVYRIIDREKGLIVLNLSRINWNERMQHAVNHMVFPPMLGLIEGDRLNQVSLETLRSDAFVLEVLRMSQSFVILTNQTYKTVKKEPVSYLGSYGRYTSHKYNYDPMLDVYGRIVPYFYRGNQPHPFMKDSHLFFVPKAFFEHTRNVMNSTVGGSKTNALTETMTHRTSPNQMEWLNLEFIKPL